MPINYNLDTFQGKINRKFSPTRLERRNVTSITMRDSVTGQSINELENGLSSYRQKGIYSEWVFMK